MVLGVLNLNPTMTLKMIWLGAPWLNPGGFKWRAVDTRHACPLAHDAMCQLKVLPAWWSPAEVSWCQCYAPKLQNFELSELFLINLFCLRYFTVLMKYSLIQRVSLIFRVYIDSEHMYQFNSFTSGYFLT